MRLNRSQSVKIDPYLGHVRPFLDRLTGNASYTHSPPPQLDLQGCFLRDVCFRCFQLYFDSEWDNFEAMDIDEDNQISRESFKDGADSLGIELTEDEADYIFDQLDVRQSNSRFCLCDI